MNRRVLSRIALFAVIASMAVTACAPAATPPPTTPQGPGTPAEPVPTELVPTPEPITLVIAVPSDVSTLDPQMESASTLIPHFQLFDSLVIRDDSGQIQPGLAISWEAIDDTTWEFRLREGVRFHNGEDFTAEDVEFSMNRIMAAGETSGPRKQYAGWFDSVEIVDDYTVRIHTVYPFPVVLGNIARQHTIVPKDYIESVGDDVFAANPVGTGPYRFVSWDINESIVLEAFDEYWGGRPAVDRLVIRVVPDEATRVAELLAGGVDILLQVPPTRIEELASAGVQVLTTPSVTILYLGVNTHESPFDNRDVREAIAHAIDIDAMIAAILPDSATRANSLVQNTSFGWNADIEPYEYDQEEARNLLSDAGLANGFSTTLDAGALDVWPGTMDVATVIAAQLAEVGISVELNVGDFTEFFGRYREGEIRGLFIFGNTAATQDADTHLYLNFRCPPGGRGIYFCSGRTDRMILDARSELVPEMREPIYWDLQEILHREVAAIPLWMYNSVVGVSSRFQWQPRADGLIYVNTVVPVGP